MTKSRMMRGMILLALSLIVAMTATASALAHPPLATSAQVNITSDGHVTVTVYHDALAFALNNTSAAVDDEDMFALLDGPEVGRISAFANGRERFMLGFRLNADNRPVPVQLTKSPDLAALAQWLKEHPNRTLPCRMEFVVTATLPPDARSITLQLPEILADTLITVRTAGHDGFSMPLRPGEQSPAIAVQVASADASMKPGDQANEREDHAPIEQPISVWRLAWRFVTLGFEHIIPEGPDHCLFVLGLFLLNPRIKPVLWQISAFTVAHTITLTLTSLNIIGLPASVVEPMIAASIAFIAVENLLTTKVNKWRYLVAFIFGLMHGMGVATVFNEAGFPPGQLVPSLAAFTVGVEAGHIVVLVVAFVALGWTRNKKWYRQRVAIPLSLIIAAIALYWMLQRLGAL